MYSSCEKEHSRWSLLRLIPIQTRCKVILKCHNSKQALLWCFNIRSKPPWLQSPCAQRWPKLCCWHLPFILARWPEGCLGLVESQTTHILPPSHRIDRSSSTPPHLPSTAQLRWDRAPIWPVVKLDATLCTHTHADTITPPWFGDAPGYHPLIPLGMRHISECAAPRLPCHSCHTIADPRGDPLQPTKQFQSCVCGGDVGVIQTQGHDESLSAISHPPGPCPVSPVGSLCANLDLVVIKLISPTLTSLMSTK